jgi:hypothetical protein
MTKTLGTIAVALVALWAGGSDVSAQDARPTSSTTTMTRGGDVKLRMSDADFTTTAGATTYGYKKWGTVEATVCNAFFGGKDKNHATLFINLAQKGSPATNCDPYSSPTVYTTVNRNMTNPSQFTSSLMGAKIRINNAFFTRDRERGRFMTYANIEKDPAAIEVMEGANYTSIKVVKADIERTDMKIVEEQQKIEEERIAERKRAEAARITTTSTTSTATVNTREKSSSTTSREGGGFSSIFDWFFRLFE